MKKEKRLDVRLLDEDYELLKNNIEIAYNLNYVDNKTISNYLRYILKVHGGNLNKIMEDKINKHKKLTND